MMDRDEQLAEILDQLAGQSHSGRMPDLELVVRDHPELEAELRELWATMALAEDFASISGVLDTLTRGDTTEDSENVSVPFPGQVGDYEPLEEIGRGGMGVVYRARQTSLGRTVALKMILRGGLASAADVARFRSEAESAARLSHPNIVPVYEVGEHDGQPYFSMQLVEGTTLAQRLQEGPMSPREAAELLAPICRAIQEAHKNGVLHRDLKPSNILIDETGRAFVTDFGLAKRIQSSEAIEGDSLSLTTLTHSGAIVGTPSYMAPEQAAGQRGEVSAATDVYSLGALLYAMLTGRAPFQAVTPLDTVLMVLEQDPVPARMLNPVADPDLELIAMKCLQKPQDLRYADTGQLADDLQAWLDGDPISARSSQFTQVLSRAFRETHHASLLENWGLLWMWHSLVVLTLCVVTNLMQWQDAATEDPSRWPYLALWCVGLSVWAAIFYSLRKRSGPVTFVERQIVHIWAGSMIASMLLYSVEWLLGLKILSLSPCIALVSGMVFLAKASMLSGKFYAQATVLFLSGVAMAWIQNSESLPNVSISIYGLVAGVSFFLPGLKYHRQRVRR